MRKSKESTIKTPSNCLLLNNEDMMYVEGGLSLTQKRAYFAL